MFRKLLKYISNYATYLFSEVKSNHALQTVFTLFTTTRISIVVVALISTLIIEKGKFFKPINSILDLFYRWDSGWYLNIISKGYTYIPDKESSVAFFPLYPMIIKVISAITSHPKIVGFIVSNIALLIACYYLYKLVQVEYDQSTATQTIILMLIAPVSFFFSIMYTEGLFLALTISAFYYARKKNWLVASIIGFFVALTKVTGVFIFIPILMEYLQISWTSLKPNFRIIKKDMLWLLLIPAGLGTYMTYLYAKFGDPIAFYHAYAAWGSKLVLATTTFELAAAKNYTFYKILFFAIVIITLLEIIYCIKCKIRLSYVTYCILLFIIFISSSLLDSILRYTSILFPLYMGLAILIKKHPPLKLPIELASIMLLTLMTVLFVNGYWVV